MFFKKTRKISANEGSKDVIVEAATDGELRVIPSNSQHVGARDNQEDAFAFSDLGDHEVIREKGILAIVADGMGGLELGEEASRVAVASFLREYELVIEGESLEQRLMRALRIANTAVYDLAYRGKSELDLGTTLIAAVIYHDHLYWVSAGDSRIYLYRDRHLHQLTTDHIYANHLLCDVENGKISKKEADEHPERSYLTSYLGLPELPEVDLCSEPLPLMAGDAVLLCSDGLFDTLKEDQIVAIIERGGSDLAGKMVGAALSVNNPHQDNITVAVLSIVMNKM